MDLWLAICLAAAVTIGGGLSLSGLHEAKVRRHQAKIDDRLNAGEDRYFEELRELEAYDPRGSNPRLSGLGQIAILAANFVILVFFLRNLDL